MASISRVRTVMTGVAGSPYYSNFYYLTNGATAQQVIDVTEGFWNNILQHMSDDLAGTVEGEVPIIDEVTGDIIAVQNGNPQTFQGVSTDDVLPPATQGLARWTTGQYRNGRQVRGRTFIPGLTDPVSEFGRPRPAFITDLQASIDFVVDNPTVTHVVWSKSNGVALATTAGSVWSEFASLRSRRD